MLEEGQVSKLERQHFEEMMEGKTFKNKCLAFKVPERKKPHEKLRSQLPSEFEPVVQPQPVKPNKRPKEEFIQPAPLVEQAEPTTKRIIKNK
jgi:hypothetical protein